VEKSRCAGHYYNRIWVITAGCVLWGIMTAGFATTHSVAQVCSTFLDELRQPNLLSRHAAAVNP